MIRALRVLRGYFFHNILMFLYRKMCNFVRYKGGDDLRVTRKPLIATHARGENARFKQTCYHCHNPLLRIVKHKTKDLYDASQ